jgi:DNA polymerase III epsilon subunit-like protein
MKPSIIQALRDCCDWARCLLGIRETLLVDTETTGLTGCDLVLGDEVVSIGIMTSGGEVLLDQDFKPERRFDPKASAVTGLSAETQAHCPPFADYHDQICELLSGATVVCFNASFDRHLIFGTCDRYGLERPPVYSWECAQQRAASVLGHKRWVSLTRALHVWTGWPYAKCNEDAHGAVADCHRLRDLLQHMAWYRAMNGRELDALWARIDAKGAR